VLVGPKYSLRERVWEGLLIGFQLDIESNDKLPDSFVLSRFHRSFVPLRRPTISFISGHAFMRSLPKG